MSFLSESRCRKILRRVGDACISLDNSANTNPQYDVKKRKKREDTTAFMQRTDAGPAQVAHSYGSAQYARSLAALVLADFVCHQTIESRSPHRHEDLCRGKDGAVRSEVQNRVLCVDSISFPFLLPFRLNSCSTDPPSTTTVLRQSLRG